VCAVIKILVETKIEDWLQLLFLYTRPIRHFWATCLQFLFGKGLTVK